MTDEATSTIMKRGTAARSTQNAHVPLCWEEKGMSKKLGVHVEGRANREYV
jgi:hypothetical protein